MVVVLPSPSGVGVMAVTSTYLALGRSLQAVEHIQVHLGLEPAIGIYIVPTQAQVGGKVDNGAQAGRLGNLQVTEHIGSSKSR